MSESATESSTSNAAGGPQRPLDFSTYLMSLGTSALVQMGEAPDPESNECQCCDLVGARQTIDLMALLEEKTAGNLNHKEESLLRSLLRDLRTRWVAAAKRERNQRQ